MTEQDEQASRWDLWADQDVKTYGAKDPQTAATFLAKLSGPAGALELGAGIGLVARALAAHGVPVTALDISPEMCARIDTSRGDVAVTTVVGDMADIPVCGPFDLIYATTSTFYSLLSQQRQLSCLSNSARLLTPHGKIVLELFAPLRQGAVTHRQNLALRAFGEDNVDISATVHDPVSQRITFREIRIAATSMNVLPVEIRYTWPSELDLMARVAGLQLLHRYSGWDGGVFDANSVRHLSVYELML